MINAVGEYASQKRFEKIHVMIDQRGFYEKFGFRKIGECYTIYNAIEQLFVRDSVV